MKDIRSMRWGGWATGVVMTGALLAWGSDALAGFKHNIGVTVSSSYARGSLGSARNSSNSVEYIGCQIIQYGSSDPYGICTARDASGTYKSCVSYDAPMIDLMLNLNDGDFLYFTEASGTCNYLNVMKFSYYEPKEH